MRRRRVVTPGYSFEHERPRLFTPHGRSVLAVVVTVLRERVPYPGQMIHAETVARVVPADLPLVVAALDHLVHAGQLRQVTDPDTVPPGRRIYAVT